MIYFMHKNGQMEIKHFMIFEYVYIYKKHDCYESYRQIKSKMQEFFWIKKGSIHQNLIS